MQLYILTDKVRNVLDHCISTFLYPDIDLEDW